MSENKTLKNLQAAFNGESNAHAKYLTFADKAKAEGYRDVYRLFTAAAKAEEIHAKGYEKIIREMKETPKADIKVPPVMSTKENLESALKGETYERDTMYPAFVKQAEFDKDTKAALHFKAALAAETQHARFLEDALSNLDSWKNGAHKFIVCGNCGYTTDDFSIAKCPVCSYPRIQYIEFK